jgi:zinc transport system substrate-binding protein
VIRIFVSVLLFACLKSTHAAKILVTSKILYSIVAPLLEGIQDPKILYSEHTCCHHHHFSPSDIQHLKEADLVIWHGKNQEPYLDTIVSRDKNYALFSEDQFKWLIPEEVEKQLPRLVDQLKINCSEKESEQLMANYKKYRTDLVALQKQLDTVMDRVNKSKVFVMSNPLQFFAEKYHLNRIAYSSSSGGKTLLQISEVIKSGVFSAVLLDKAHSDESGIKLLTGKNIQICEIDGEGLGLYPQDRSYKKFIGNFIASIVELSSMKVCNEISIYNRQ